MNTQGDIETSRPQTESAVNTLQTPLDTDPEAGATFSWDAWIPSWRALPTFNYYVLVHYCGGNWEDGHDTSHRCELKVMRLSMGNGSEVFWKEFGSGEYALSYIDFWMHLPPVPAFDTKTKGPVVTISEEMLRRVVRAAELSAEAELRMVEAARAARAAHAAADAVIGDFFERQ